MPPKNCLSFGLMQAFVSAMKFTTQFNNSTRNLTLKCMNFSHAINQALDKWTSFLVSFFSIIKYLSKCIHTLHAWLHLLSPIHVNSIKRLLKLLSSKVKMLCTVLNWSRLSVHVSTFHIFGSLSCSSKL